MSAGELPKEAAGHPRPPLYELWSHVRDDDTGREVCRRFVTTSDLNKALFLFNNANAMGLKSFLRERRRDGTWAVKVWGEQQQ